MTIKDYNKLVEKHSDGLFRFLVKQIGSADIVEDIMQESFLRLWENRRRVDSSKAKSYLFTIAYNRMIDELRRDRYISLETDKKAKSNSRSIDLKELLDQALSQLPHIQRSLVLLRDYEGYSYSEIGEILGISQEKVKVYLFRARKTLREYIGSIDNII